MLVLSRRTGEAVNIGDDVVVTVLQVRGGQVRIGVTAPKGLKIIRDELAGKPDTDPAKGIMRQQRLGETNGQQEKTADA